MTCTGDALPGVAASPWHLSLGFGASETDLAFGDVEVGLRRRALGLALERELDDGWSLGASAGLAPGGWLDLGAERHELGLGGYGSLAASYRILDGRGEEPFLVLSLALGASAAPSEGAGESATLVGTDARAAFTLGKMFWRSFGPYAVVRLFGGPVLWRRGGEALVGTDRHHYQLGAGLLVTGETVGASLEVVPLGERNLTLGATVAF